MEAVTRERWYSGGRSDRLQLRLRFTQWDALGWTRQGGLTKSVSLLTPEARCGGQMDKNGHEDEE
jgi:hypothetical protein